MSTEIQTRRAIRRFVEAGAVKVDTTRPIFCGVHHDARHFIVTCDSHRLHVVGDVGFANNKTYALDGFSEIPGKFFDLNSLGSVQVASVLLGSLDIVRILTPFLQLKTPIDVAYESGKFYLWVDLSGITRLQTRIKVVATRTNYTVGAGGLIGQVDPISVESVRGKINPKYLADAIKFAAAVSPLVSIGLPLAPAPALFIVTPVDMPRCGAIIAPISTSEEDKILEEEWLVGP